jgi:large subunit ribosomal protein L24
MATFKNFKTGDTVRIISGDLKGTEAKVVKMLPRENKALLENIGLRTRHVKANQLNPKGSKKEIHVGIELSKLALVKEEKKK